MELETDYLKDCEKLSKITGFSIEEIFDNVVGLVVDKKHEYYGKIGIFDNVILGNNTFSILYKIQFSKRKKVIFENSSQIYLTKNLNEIINRKEKQGYLFEI
ncbi:MAG: hypothetical protein WCX73_00065 [Candidatus Pacearchaeota archaeon]|jgi:dihydrofolate reductase